MIQLKDYEVQEVIYQSKNSIIYKASKRETRTPVILKVLRENRTSPERIARFKYEYKITQALQSDHVINVFDLENDRQFWFLVLEDFGGRSLDLLDLAGSFALETFLDLALNLVQGLAFIHASGVVHKDINPSNVVFNPKTGIVKLIDFGISSQLRQEQMSFKVVPRLEGTPAYMSPEQTGRVNAPLDFRSDFYALGISFFELLSGQLPFPAKDLVQLIHAHLARNPPMLSDWNPEVPAVLAEIVAKLMAKDTANRYQSHQGLAEDLRTCRRAWKSHKAIERFALGRQDFSTHFEIPARLYGRSAETKQLLQVLEQAAHAEACFFCIAGYSGIGKTSLVREIYRPLTLRQGHFIAGKFEQFSQNRHYHALIQAFQGLLLGLYGASESVRESLREALRQTLEPNGALILEVLPDLEFITGPFEPVPLLAPDLAKARFNLTFRKFVEVFIRPDRPLVIFLDDLQWADQGSLAFIENLLTFAPPRGLLLMGAYRDNEVDGAHPLRLSLDRLEQEGKKPLEMTLKPLRVTAVAELLADTLGHSQADVEALAELVHSRTGGNPFFLKTFLTSLHEDKLLYFSPAEQGWDWDFPAIREKSVTANVLALVSKNLHHLPQESRQVLSQAALIGHGFDVKTLAAVRGEKLVTTLDFLWPVAKAGLIHPQSDAYKLIHDHSRCDGDGSPAIFKFAHDRIQAAAYQLIPSQQRATLHWQIGQFFISNRKREGQDLFEMVDQLNQGATQANQTERFDLAKLNHQAGLQARVAGSFQPMYPYFLQALQLLELRKGPQEPGRSLDELEPEWTPFASRLYGDTVEAAFLCGDLERVEPLVTTILDEVNDLEVRVKAYETRIQCYRIKSQNREALQSSIEVLQLLGVTLPLQPDADYLEARLKEVDQLLVGRKISSLIDLPRMVDPEKLAAMRILEQLLLCIGSVAPEMYPYVPINQVLLSIRFGNTDTSITAYNNYGCTACMPAFQIDAAYDFHQLAMALMEKLDAKKHKPMVLVQASIFILPFKKPLDQLAQDLEGNYELGLATGDVHMSINSHHTQALTMFFAGRNLADIHKRYLRSHEILKLWKSDLFLEWQNVNLQPVDNLLQAKDNAWVLNGPFFDEAAYLARDESLKNQVTMRVISQFQTMLSYRFGRFQEAAAKAPVFSPANLAAIGIAIPWVNLYRALAYIAIAADAAKAMRSKLLTMAGQDLERLRKWASFCPENYAAMVALVEAEFARIYAADTEARAFYDQAILLARRHGFLNVESLAFEIAARFYLERDQMRLAGYHMRDAYYAYQRWGAIAKVRDLETRYPHLLEVPGAVLPQLGKAGENKTGEQPNSLLDLASMAKAAQAISGEIILDRLIPNLMMTVMENAGAEQGCFILNHQDGWHIKASFDMNAQEKVHIQQMPLKKGGQQLPFALVNYVLHTGETVTSLETSMRPFANDPYLIETKPRSVLCMPIQFQEEIMGALYLEHRCMREVFTPLRMEIMNLLCSQTAISIENADLYRELEGKVAERTEALTQALDQLEKKHLELKQAQSSLVHAEKMASLGPLTAGIAHEINNPICIVDAVSQNNLTDLKQFKNEILEMAADSPQEIHQFISKRFDGLIHATNKIRNGSDRVKALVSDLRIFTGHEEADVQSVSVLEGLKATINLVRSNFESHIQLTTKFHADPILECHPRQLDQVFLNLLMNAHQAIQAKTRVSGGDKIVVTTAQADQNFIIRFEDNGVGMPAAVRDRIFEPFFTTRPVGSGTGLGLAIAYGIVNEHHGRLEVDTIEGEGTTVTMILPLKTSSS